MLGNTSLQAKGGGPASAEGGVIIGDLAVKAEKGSSFVTGVKSTGNVQSNAGNVVFPELPAWMKQGDSHSQKSQTQVVEKRISPQEKGYRRLAHFISCRDCET